MSRHEGVSCDSCLKGNFRGRRYKCLICYDYDLCEACYEAGATNTRHGTDHPMQCILTRADFDLFYAGEAITNVDQPQAYTCPYCSRMGFTDATLQEHVAADHGDTSYEVVCPVCAASPGGDPNLMTDDFAGHLTLEHRTGTRDLISFLDEPVSGSRHNVRRIPHSGHLSGSGGGRGGTTARPRRSNMHFSVFSSAGLTSLSPSSRDPVDPIAELLSQLSGVRRSTSNTNSSSSTTTPSQLQQLQMQLQLERAQVSAARQQLERLPSRRQNQSQAATLRESSSSSNANPGYSILLNPSSTSQANNQPSSAAASAPPVPGSPVSSNFLLEGLLEELTLQTTAAEQGFNDRYQFAENLLVGTMTFLKNQDHHVKSNGGGLGADGENDDDNGEFRNGGFTNQAQELPRVYPAASCEEEDQEEEAATAEDEEQASSNNDETNTTTTSPAADSAAQMTESAPPRASASNTRVLRGRARSDGHNALRRADANKSQPPPPQQQQNPPSQDSSGGKKSTITKSAAPVLR